MNIGVLAAALVIFLVIVLLLVSVLLYVKAKVTPNGNVTLTVNGEKTISAAPGASLLATLGDNRIFLPSACGGTGTCGLCKCRVPSGGGEILPTETGFLTRRQQQEHWRLGCQVKVREDMRLDIPEEIMGIKKWTCEVASNRNVATFIKELVVKLPPGERLDFRSGGYIQIDVPECDVDFRDITVEPEFQADWDSMKLWDLKMKNPAPAVRAYSMANYPAEGNIIKLNIRIATPPRDREKQAFAAVNPGVGSSYLFARRPGDRLTVAGPYGEFFLRDTAGEIIFIGGGAGMAPMRSHIFHLFRTLKTKRKVSFWYGARSRQEVFYENDFRALEKDFPNFKYTIALSDPRPEDRWTGPAGFIHQALYDGYLKDSDAPEDIEYYLCGPPAMTDAVTGLLDSLGVPQEMIMFDNFGS